MQPWSQPLLWKGGAASGTPPTYVNAGTYIEVTAASVTPPLPASRTNSNLLVAYVRLAGPVTGSFTVSSGWTIGASVNQGVHNRPMVVAYCYVTGSEAAPIFTLGSTQVLDSQVLQYHGVVASAPFGNVTVGWYDGSTAFDAGGILPVRCPSMTSAYPGSVALNIAMNNTAGSTSTPTGWTFRTSGTGSAIADLPLPTMGTATGAISLPDTGIANWTEFIIEVRSQ